MSVREELQRIYDEFGEIRAEKVVAVASAADHPLHHKFEWNNSEAAHRYRLTQAESMIRSVKVVIDRGPTAEPIQVRAYVAQQELGTDVAAGPGTYRDVREVISNDVARAAWFQTMRRDWERLRRKYEIHKEFADMVLGDLQGVAS